MKKIAVLMGGKSNEREVSLASGKNVAEALASLGKYEVVSVDLKEESLDAMPRDVDAAYIALHGGWGENGGVQAALNAMGIPYTGPGVLASQIAMDKVKTKMVLEMNAVPTPAWGLANPDTETPPIPLPAVVKPPCDGSSVGISKVSKADEWAKARDLAFSAQGGSPNGQGVVLVEEFIPGREFSVGVIDGDPLPVIEIVAEGGWYGYHEKYESDKTRYPFREEGELSAKLKDLAVKSYKAVGCRGVTRIDMRVSPLGRPYVLELNTSPGFTAHSLVPQAGMKAGATLAEVCDKILSSAAVDK